MAFMKRAETVIVFDLDDTLYPERDYQRSGIRAVCAMLLATHGKDVEAELAEFAKEGGVDLWGKACQLLGLPDTMIPSLLWTYRLHKPDIALDAMTRETVFEMHRTCRAVVILTDGRSITQRLKLEALGLSNFPCLVSEEHGSEKPEPKRFALVMDQFPAAHYVYVGDNPKKDFIAPNALGWMTVGLRAADANIHHYDLKLLRDEALPGIWINRVADLTDVINQQEFRTL
jgi:putative hydrolase of the HAD superfamily